MITNDDVFPEIMKTVDKGLKEFHSHIHRARRYSKRFLLAFTKNDREFVLKEILNSQNKSIIKAIADRKNIAIPNIGSFRYRETLEVIRAIKNEVKNEYHVNDMRDCDPIIAEVIREKVEVRKRMIVLPLYFKQLGSKGSTVNTNFLKK